MGNQLAELVKVGYFEEVKYNVYGDVLNNSDLLNIRMKNHNIVIRLHNKKSGWATISAKTNDKQNIELYNMIKDELIEIHEPCSEFIEFHETKANKNAYSFFAIGIKKGIESEEVEEVKELEEAYMYKLLGALIERIYM